MQSGAPGMTTVPFLMSPFVCLCIIYLLFVFFQSILLKWTKGFKASGCEGEDVVTLLKEAIHRREVGAIVQVPMHGYPRRRHSADPDVLVPQCPRWPLYSESGQYHMLLLCWREISFITQQWLINYWTWVLRADHNSLLYKQKPVIQWQVLLEGFEEK